MTDSAQTAGLGLDSRSIGDPARFLTLDALVAGLDALPAAPADSGTVTAVVIRGEDGARITPDRAQLSSRGGTVGDAWARRDEPNPDAQITAMQDDVARLLANGQPLALFGDNLVLDLVISEANLPVGSRVTIGSALVEVTPKPHTGCVKFRGRVGADALRFVSDPASRARRLRGVYFRVIEDGEAGPGSPVAVVRRGHDT